MPLARDAIHHYMQKNAIPYHVKKSGNENYRLVCTKSPGICTFIVSANRRKNGWIVVSQASLRHSCSVSAKDFRLSQKFLTSLIQDKLEENPSVQLDTLRNSLKDAIVLPVSKTKLYRARRICLAQVASTSKASFGSILPYHAKLIAAMPDTTALLERDTENRFMRSFLFLGPCKQIFHYSLPIIILNYYAIMNCERGLLLVASTLDGNKQAVPLAFAMCNGGANESWDWFLFQLKAACQFLDAPDLRITVLSCREEPIVDAVNQHLPLAEHLCCVEHVQKAIAAKFKGDVTPHLWKAAKTYDREEFNRLLQVIRKINPETHDYLNLVGLRLWSLAWSPLPRFGIVTTDVTHFLDAWMDEILAKSHFEILVAISRKVMDLFHTRKVESSSLPPSLVPSSMQLLNDMIQNAAKLQIIGYTPQNSIVQDGKMEYVVNLDERTCQCNRFADNMFPCVHAISVARAADYDIGTLINPGYSTEYIKSIYASDIIPVSTGFLENDELLPPPEASLSSKCPKIVHNLFPSEPKKRGSFTCSLCKQNGHNRRSCPSRPGTLE